MIRAGDEIGHTQLGNNNAYCQDNEISWLNWEHADQESLEFTRRLVRFRKRGPGAVTVEPGAIAAHARRA